MFRCVRGYRFMGSWSRVAGGLASLGYSHPLCGKEYEACVDRKCAAPARWGVSLLALGSQGECNVCVCVCVWRL